MAPLCVESYLIMSILLFYCVYTDILLYQSTLSFYDELFFHIFLYNPLFIFGEKVVSKENFNLLKLNQAPLPPKGTAGADGGVLYFHFVLYVSVCHIIPPPPPPPHSPSAPHFSFIYHIVSFEIHP